MHALLKKLKIFENFYDKHLINRILGRIPALPFGKEFRAIPCACTENFFRARNTEVHGILHGIGIFLVNLY